FVKLKKSLFQLNEEGIHFETVEILEATTDFEPSRVNPRYPYYNKLFSDPSLYDLPVRPTLPAPRIPVLESESKKVACIYYDKHDSPPLVDRVGDIHSVMLQSI